MNLKKLFATSAVFALTVSLFAPAINSVKASYNEEITGAYNYAFSKKVTTTPSVDVSNPFGDAIRAHVAKMMSNWALDVMKKEPNLDVVPNFSDVADQTEEMKGYINKAAQQGLMGQKNDGGLKDMFYPNAKVTRAQFGTMLSRALWGNKNNGGTPYYAKHLEALKAAGIMKNTSNPEAVEKRAWIWVMLQRADNWNTAQASTEQDITDCMALMNDAEAFEACVEGLTGDENTDENEDNDDDVVVIEKNGDLSVTLAKSTPDGRIALNTDREEFTKFKVSADKEDVKLYSITVDNVGLGDSEYIKNVSVYDENDREVVKSVKSFGSKDDITLTFVKGLTVKKGGSETFTLVGKVGTGSDTNTTYGLAVTKMNTSAKEVDGLPVEGNDMLTITVSNVAKLKVTGSSESGKLEVGEEKTLALFKLEETSDKEDAEVSNIKVVLSGDNDVVFDNLKLYADGKEVEDAKITRDADDELNIAMDYTIPQDKKVEFKLKGTVAELADNKFQFVIEKAADIKARGAKKHKNAAVDGTFKLNVSGEWETEGAEITASFDKSKKDEVKDDSDDVLFGTLKLKSNGTNYILHDYCVTVTVNPGVVKNVVKDLKLGGTTYDNADPSDANSGSVNYCFDELDIRADESLKLPITLDIEKDVTNDVEVKVIADINGSKLENTDDDKDYTSFNSYFSSTDFADKKMTVEQPKLTWTKKSLSPRNVILGNQDEIVYKAKVSVGDADTVKLKDVKFKATITGTGTLDELVQGATLEIGGESYSDDDITADKISFTSMNHVFEEGESNVDVYLTVTMKTKDGFVGTLKFNAIDDSVVAEDSDGDDLTDANTDVQDTFGPVLTVSDHGQLEVNAYLEDENGAVEIDSVEFDKYAVAGSEGKVALAKLKLKANREDFKLEELTFTGADTNGFDDSVNEYILSVDGEDYGAVESDVASNVLTLTFKNVDYTLEKGKVKYVTVYAMLKKLDLDESAVDSAKLGAKLENLKLTAAKFEGKDSGDDEEVTGMLSTVLPTADAKATTVSASSIASIELLKVKKALVAGENEVAQLKIVSTETDNVDADGEKIYPWLYSLQTGDFTIAGSNGLAATITKIEKVGGSTGAVALGTALTGTLGADAEIKGTVTYKIYADVSALGSSDTPYAEIKLLDKNSPVFLQYEGATATETVKYFVPKGTAKSQTVTTN